MKTKRILCLLLALTMVLSTMPYGAFAAETENSEKLITYEAEWTNPVYDVAVTAPPAEESAIDNRAVDYFTTVEEAGAYLRQQMVNRETTVEFQFTAENFSQATFDVIYEEAIKHTGVPTEGDSLNFVCGGWASGASGIVGDPFLTVTYNITYYTDAAQEGALTSAINDLKANLNLDGKTDYQIIKGIYDYMTANIAYDYTNKGNTGYKLQYTAYAALVNKTSVCQGYATLFYRLALSYGIDARIISGKSHGENHAWNIVKLGGKYYYLDSTWDSTWDGDKTNHDYFLKGTGDFGDHDADEEYKAASFAAAYPIDAANYVVTDADINGNQPGTEPEPEQPAPHVCSLTLVGKVDSTCTKAGKQAYYTCSCGRNYEDAAGIKPIADLTVWGVIQAKDHDWIPATCTVLKTCKACSKTEGVLNAHQEETIPGKAATMASDGMTAGKHCSICHEIIINQATVPAIGNVALSYNQQTYTGKTIAAPMLNVTDRAGKALAQDTDYTVSGLTDKTDVGRYAVTVTFKGNYAGSETLYYTIVPKKTASAKASLYGYDDIKFSWSKVTGASGYLIYYKKGSGAWSEAITTTKTSCKKANLSDGVKYTFKVVPFYKAADGAMYCDDSQYKTAYTHTLKKVSGVKVIKSGTKVKVSWKNINGETGYQISKMTKKSATQKKPLTYKTTSGKYKKLTATKGKTYYYKVRAYKVVDGKKIYGPWSSPVKFKRK